MRRRGNRTPNNFSWLITYLSAKLQAFLTSFFSSYLCVRAVSTDQLKNTACTQMDKGNDVFANLLDHEEGGCCSNPDVEDADPSDTEGSEDGPPQDQTSGFDLEVTCFLFRIFVQSQIPSWNFLRVCDFLVRVSDFLVQYFLYCISDVEDPMNFPDTYILDPTPEETG